ncbi:uncharacterized protein LOC128730569 [Anopheles nili]|uniref:uncharacterized protein LOC128730569 n=1 Tax=Anopheles nili TaxID=185578 RepID=UPI00237BE6F4|nr:uncharacterized protein LOC128730569 [Anopheles nili]
MEIIKLKAKDGEIINTKRSVLKISEILQKMMEELTPVEDGENLLTVPDVDGDCLCKIVMWMEHYAEVQDKRSGRDSEDIEIPNNQEQHPQWLGGTAKNNAWNIEFFSNFPQIFIMIAAANRLKVHSLVDAAVHFLFACSKGKHSEEIRDLAENGVIEIPATIHDSMEI